MFPWELKGSHLLSILIIDVVHEYQYSKVKIKSKAFCVVEQLNNH